MVTKVMKLTHKGTFVLQFLKSINRSQIKLEEKLGSMYVYRMYMNSFWSVKLFDLLEL